MSASSQILEQERCGTSALSLRDLLVPGYVFITRSFPAGEGCICRGLLVFPAEPFDQSCLSGASGSPSLSTRWWHSR